MQSNSSCPVGATPDSTGTTQAEGSMVNNMLSQMMSLLSTEQVAGARGGQGDMFQFLQSVCCQMSQLQAADKQQTVDDSSNNEGTEKETAGVER